METLYNSRAASGEVELQAHHWQLHRDPITTQSQRHWALTRLACEISRNLQMLGSK